MMVDEIQSFQDYPEHLSHLHQNKQGKIQILKLLIHVDILFYFHANGHDATDGSLGLDSHNEHSRLKLAYLPDVTN